MVGADVARALGAGDGRALRPARRDDLLALPLEVAPGLLGARLRTIVDGAEVLLRITEVEAYHGKGVGDRHDPGSHARMGRTARNATMWGEPGRLYVYLSHGIHSCVNVVCGPDGVAGGVLLRAGEVEAGVETAAVRRGITPVLRMDSPGAAKTTRIAPQIEVHPELRPAQLRDLARGPGRFGQASGLRHPQHDGIDAITGVERGGAVAELWLGEPLAEFASGPRVGVAGHAGTGAFPWRFWIPGDPTVSPFRWGRGAAEAATAADTPGIGSVLE